MEIKIMAGKQSLLRKTIEKWNLVNEKYTQQLDSIFEFFSKIYSLKLFIILALHIPGVCQKK